MKTRATFFVYAALMVIFVLALFGFPLALRGADPAPIPIRVTGDALHNLLDSYNIGTGKTITFRSGSTLTILSGATVNFDLGVISWASVSKTGSSLADLETRSAGALSSGTLLAARLPAFTGDATSTAGSSGLVLATVNSSPGTFAGLTINAKGLVTAAAALTITTSAPLAGGGTLGNLTISIPASTNSLDGYLTAADHTTFAAKQPAGSYITSLTGDGTASGPGAASFVLAAVATGATTGGSTAIPVVTFNNKGLVTGVTTAAVIAPAGTLTGTTLAANVVTSSLTSVGTITAGVWHGTSIDLAARVSGNLAVSHLNSGTGATASSYWRGDGTWAPAGGAGKTVSGPISLFMFDEGFGNMIANRAGGSAPWYVNNLLAPLGSYSGGLWTGTSVVTPDYAQGPFPGTRAARFNTLTGTELTQNVNILGGAYAESVWVSSNTGVLQTMRINFNGDYGTDLTVPATGWVRLSRTGSTSAGTSAFSPVVTNAANGPLDVLFYGPQLEVGGTATNGAYDGLVVRGSPAWTSAGLNFGAGGGAAYSAQSIPGYNMSAGITMVVAFMWPTSATPPDADHVLMMGDPTGQFYMSARDGHTYPEIVVGNRQFTTKLVPDLKDSVWHIAVGSWSASDLYTRLWIDGVEVGSLQGALSTTLLSDSIGVLSFQGNGWRMPATAAYAALYNTGQTPTQIRATIVDVQTLLASRGVTQSNQALIGYEGDSITADQGPSLNTYPYLLTIPAARLPRNYAVSGSTVADMVTRATNVLPPNVPVAAKILTVLIGHNDMASGDSAATFFANLKSYCLARKAEGWVVVVATVLPSTVSGFNVKRNAANVLIRADPSFYDALCDFDTNPTIGADAAASNVTYYSDGTHPTQAGQNLLAPIMQATINPLL